MGNFAEMTIEKGPIQKKNVILAHMMDQKKVF